MIYISKSKQAMGFIFWLVITFIAAGIGTVASIKAGIFYQQLIRPEWAPPGWLFAPVWTTLYLLMSIDAWMVWRAKGFSTARISLSIYIIQLALNALWTWLFFVWRLGKISFIEIIILWIFILFTLIAFWRVKMINGIILVPYLAWVSFASVLNYVICKLNPLILI
jgi:translocator protein